MKNKHKILLVIFCFAPLMKLALPVHAWNAQKAKQIGCYIQGAGGSVHVANGSQCVEGGSVCYENGCPGNSSPLE